MLGGLAVSTMDILTLNEVAAILKSPVGEIERLVASGELKAFRIGGEYRTTASAVHATINNLMEAGIQGHTAISGGSSIAPGTGLTSTSQPKVSDLKLRLPTLDEIRSITWETVGPCKYVSRNGQTVTVDDETYGHTFDLGGNKASLLISLFGSEGGRAQGESYPNWIARVSFGTIGHGPQAVNEWLRTDAYETTREIASVIKNGAAYAKPGDQIDPEYSQLGVQIYNKVITRPHTRVTQCVVCKDDDKATMALHALIRCRQQGRI